MKVISIRYPIAQGRIQGIPLSKLIKDTNMEIVKNEGSSSVENTLRNPGRFYDELGL